MYNKRTKKRCPFCQGRLMRKWDDYVCRKCGVAFSATAMSDNLRIKMSSYR